MNSGVLRKTEETADTRCSANPAVECRKLCLAYGNCLNALESVTINFQSGLHYGLMGPSGSGKTSLLGCIAGRLEPGSGLIRRAGRVATIHQDLRLVAEKSAIDNVIDGALCRHPLSRSVFGFPKHERDRAIQLLCRVGLCEKIYVQVRKLSGGEQQRVAIARALMQDPSILLADEPVASLDEDNARQIMELITALAKERKLTVISALHDYDLARAYTDRIVRLVNGRVVYDRESSAQGFVQNPALTVLRNSALDSSLHELSQESIPERPVAWRSWLGMIGVLMLLLWASSGLDLEGAQLSNAAEGVFNFLVQLLPSSWAQLRAIPWSTLFAALVETLQMAVLGTALGLVLAGPLAALGSRNIGPAYVHAAVRFLLNVVRTVPSLIWALMFVAAVGLGPLAGILALSMYSLGYLTKFFYEAFEGVEPGPPDALSEIGASGLQKFVHAIWPAAMPAVISSSFFMLEYNVRSASILGVVDAGGIGFYMKQYLDYRAFPSLLASLGMILVVVVAFDLVSSRIRRKLVGG